jgi:hypothetical protein
MEKDGEKSVKSLDYCSKQEKNSKTSFNPHLKTANARWVALFLLTFIESCNTFANELPAPLQVYLQQIDFRWTTVEYESLFTCSYVMVAIFSLVGGYLAHVFGPDNVLFFIVLSHCIGKLVFKLFCIVLSDKMKESRVRLKTNSNWIGF